ncbi:MAG: diguanylate cyclase [Gammaproteobacteria bacterium]|nr:diguanylate cyclase [Gammaproteobacteria bacterium]MDH3415541.1 diguanylate cyclase [Gammaproteobacteria bacterium]
METLDLLLRSALGIGALLYLLLAIRVARAGSQYDSNVIACFFFLAGLLVAGAAISFGTDDPRIYGVGRTLTFFSSGFLPVVFYVVYREYTVGPPRAILIAMLSVIPIATTVLALTNSAHGIIWAVIESETGIRFTDVTQHFWFNRVHMPFMYGIFLYTAFALAGRLPTIALAHRRIVIILLVSAVLPFAASVMNVVLKIGPLDFPFTASSFVLLLPLYAYAVLSIRFYEFSPVAYQTLFDHVRDPIFVIDKEEKIICANQKAQELLGGTERELIGQRLWEDFPEARAILKQANELDLTQTLRFHKDNIYELSVAPLTGRKGQALGMVVVCRDVTERRKALSKLSDSEHLIRTLIETSSSGILRFSQDRSEEGPRFRCIFANRAAESYLGFDDSALVGMPLDKLLQLEPQRLITHFTGASGKRSPISFETSADHAAGESWLRIVVEPVGDDLSVTLIDITQRKRNEDKMLADALRDPLTGVLNRRGFEKEGIASIRANDQGAVIYLDLNQFKTINDRFGHQAGDALLKAFGHRLGFCLRPEDVMGRLGGDEFAIVLPGVSVEDAKHVAARLVQTAQEAYIIQGEEIKCTASVGIALMPKHGEELWHLISVADQAMYSAKDLDQDEAANDRAAYVDAATAT